MEQRDGLLLHSDDSDIPDLDLPTANIRTGRPRLFGKSRKNVETKLGRRRCCNILEILISLLVSIIIAIIFLGILSIYILSQLDELRHDQKFEIISREMEIVKREVNRIKTDIDMLRLITSSPGTLSWNATVLLNTRLESIETQISDLIIKIQERPSGHFENDALNLLSERLKEIENACIHGCGAISDLATNTTKHFEYSLIGEKSKKKRSKISRWQFIRDIPVVFTRAKYA